MTSLSDFLAHSTTATIVLGQRPTGEDATIEVTFDPHAITPATDKKIQRLSEDGDSLAIGRVLRDTISAWTLMGPFAADVPQRGEDGEVLLSEDGDEVTERTVLVPDGQVVPLEAEILQYLSHGVILSIWSGIVEATVPKVERKSSRRSRRR